MTPPTKEQAEWFVEQLKNLPCKYIHRLPDWMDMLTRAQEIITQCAEKEFPKFTLYDEEKCFILDIKCCADSWILISNDDDSIRLRMSPEKFEEFATGCNKIVEWLNEQ